MSPAPGCLQRHGQCRRDRESVLTGLVPPGACEGQGAVESLAWGRRPSLCQVPVAKHLIPQALVWKAENQHPPCGLEAAAEPMGACVGLLGSLHRWYGLKQAALHYGPLGSRGVRLGPCDTSGDGCVPDLYPGAAGGGP